MNNNNKSIEKSNDFQYKSVLSHRGYSIPLIEISSNDLSLHEGNLTVIPYVEKEEYAFAVKPIKLYTLSEKRIYMPRHYGLKHFGKPAVDKLTTKKYPIRKNLTTIIKPRTHQIPIMKKVLKDLNTTHGGVISIFCGGGKTVLAILIACTKKIKTLVVCHTTSLMLQWKERIEEFAPRAKIGIVQQSTTEIEGKDIIIASLKTIALRDYPKGTFDSVGLVVWDEIHLMCTNLFSSAFPKLTTTYSIGLSATPFRKDKCDVIFENHIGPILYTLKREKNETIIAKCIKLLLPPSSIPIVYNKYGKIQYTTTLTKVMYNECRTARIVDMIIDYAESGRKILVLSEYIKHLKDIKAQITKTLKERAKKSLKGVAISNLTKKQRTELNNNVNTFTYDLYIGEMKNAARKESEQKDVILGTYKLASVGMDIPKLNTLILASPRKEIEQSVGRILRKDKTAGSKHKPLIVDIIDNHGIFVNQSNIRKKFYKKYGYTLEHIQMLPDGHVKTRRVVSTMRSKDVPKLIVPGAKPMPTTSFFKPRKLHDDDDESSENLGCMIDEED